MMVIVKAAAGLLCVRHCPGALWLFSHLSLSCNKPGGIESVGVCAVQTKRAVNPLNLGSGFLFGILSGSRHSFSS